MGFPFGGAVIDFDFHTVVDELVHLQMDRFNEP